MKVIVETEDKHEIEQLLRATDMALVLWKLDNSLRKAESLEDFRDDFYDLLEIHNLDLERLSS